MTRLERSEHSRSRLRSWLRRVLLLHTAAASLRTISGAGSRAAARNVSRYLASLPERAGRERQRAGAVTAAVLLAPHHARVA